MQISRGRHSPARTLEWSGLAVITKQWGDQCAGAATVRGGKEGKKPNRIGSQKRVLGRPLMNRGI